MSKEMPKSKKEQTQEEISSVKENAKKIKDKGRDLIEYGQSLEDLADATGEYIISVDNMPPLDGIYDNFKLLNEQTSFVIAKSTEMDFGPVYSTTATASLSISTDLHPNCVLPLNDSSKHKLIISKYSEIEKVTQRNASEEEIVELFKEFDLEKAPKGRKSVLEHFIISQSAFKKPITDDNPISTSLIPMRECIRTLIDTLLKYRPKQEKTRNEESKIISIGMQLKKDSVPESLILSLANKWVEILGRDLSSAKEINISREEWQHRLTNSTLFIKSLLTALEVKKRK